MLASSATSGLPASSLVSQASTVTYVISADPAVCGPQLYNSLNDEHVMSQEMNRIPARHLANSPSLSKLTSSRGYLGSAANTAPYSTSTPTNTGSRQMEERQGWRSWAGEKARKLGNYGLYGGWRGAGANEASDSVEQVTLFPGWAARRYRKAIPGDEGSPRPFEVEVFTSGYAISYKNRDTMSRSQRAFIRVAKGFAALPKLASQSNSSSQTSLVAPEPVPLTRSTEDLLSQIHLPPRPEEIKDGYDTDALDREFSRARLESDTDNSTSDLVSALKNAEDRAGTMVQASSDLVPDSVLLQRWHANLEARLQPFWSSVVTNRPVRLHLFASPHQDPSSPPTDDHHKPLASVETTTDSDGAFQAKFVVKWDELCHHPRALQIAFGEAVDEHTLVVVAELLKPQAVETSGYAQYQSARRMQQPAASNVSTTSRVHIPVTHCPIRVISDIDDTVKDSGVLNGARAVFHNVFVKDLRDCVVPGMGEWYTNMWKQGIRFHYVSNGPFEYLSVLNDFFPLSQLPPGSIKLRSFAGRSLFNGFFSAPAARKRAGVEDILKAFPESRFILVGDSGEQDLELYAELSKLYPNNVLGVFIRDVTTKEGVTDPLDDPTGWNALALQQSANNTLQPIDVSSEAGSNSSIPSPTTYQPRSPNSRRNVLMGVGKKSSNSISSLWSYKDRPDHDPSGRNGDPGAHLYTGSSSSNGNGPRPTVTAEPDSYAPDETPKIPALENSQTIKANRPEVARSKSSTTSSWNNGVITEPPKPTLPPSVPSSNYGPVPSSNSSSSSSPWHTPDSRSSRKAVSRAQRTGTSSSASSQASMDERDRVSRQSTGLSLPTSGAGLTLEDRKRNELQMRVWRARTVMPGHVKLRMFRHPKECVEVDETLKREAE